MVRDVSINLWIPGALAPGGESRVKGTIEIVHVIIPYPYKYKKY